MIKLHPCPFCNEREDLEEHTDDYKEFNFKRVRCMNCGALGPDSSTWLKAQELWNLRRPWHDRG